MGLGGAGAASGGAGAASGGAGAAGTAGMAGAGGEAGAAGAGGAAGSCGTLRVAFVTPPNAKHNVSAAERVSAMFSCPPDREQSGAAMRLSGEFAGRLGLSFPASAQPNEIVMLPSAPDPRRLLPYFPGELLTGWIGSDLGGPYLWQFRASVRSSSSATFSDSQQSLPSAQYVRLGDLDGDGDLDMVLSGRRNSQLDVALPNDGYGNFGSPTPLGVSNGRVLLADLDGDGDLDIASASIFINDGGFRFRETEKFEAPFALADFDGDGDVDAVTGSPTGIPFDWALQLNDGAAHFSRQSLGAASVFDVQAGDLDNDGDLDLVALVYDGEPPRSRGIVLLNDGKAHFLESGSFSVDATRSLSLGDLDGDGDLDMLSTSWGAAGARNPANQVWLNDGHGQLSSSNAASAGSVDGVLGDLDGDGDLDAIIGDHDPYSVTPGRPSVVMLNDGHGSFAAAGSLGGPNFHRIQLGDLDGDGDLDAAIAQWSWSGEPAALVLFQNP
ncbi:MAG: FG-GAP-like repeat-containing protein [Polyangiaceae bacterium]